MFVRSRAQIAVIAGFCAIFNSIFFIIVLRQDPLLLRNPPQPPQDNSFSATSKFMIGRHYLSIPSAPFRSRRSFRLRGRKSPSIAGVSLDDNQPIHRRHPLRSVLQDDAYVESIRQMRDSVDGAIRPTDHQIINFRVPFQRR